MFLPEEVNVIEVGPRDGLQNIPEIIDTEDKIELVNSLSKTGLRRIEVTSFVHPKAVPQMKDAAVVLSRICKRREVRYCVLVPNETGAGLALDAGASELNAVISASESHNMLNIKRTIAQSLEEFKKISSLCKEHGIIWLKATIATAFGCPFEGKMDSSKIIEIASRLIQSGAMEIILADTAGMGNPVQVQMLIDDLRKVLGDTDLTVHFHNTRGNGMVNIFSALLAGVSNIETSIGGLGGCPFVPGAAGNVATEDLVNLMDDMGIKTGVHLKALIDCAKIVKRIVKTDTYGYVLKVGPTFTLHPLEYINNITNK
ncbi:MAG: hydroxymethylglutaryl-CoA lyase [Clostridiales bacterium]|nr:hydroxymethylglutaryl-CoA lyase [Clostridiales bacterium]